MGALGVLFGPPGAGKSFVALDWACSIATGRKWQGHEVKQGPVVYVAAEGAAGLGQRLRAWKAKSGIDSVDVYFLPEAVQLLQRNDMRGLLSAIRASLDTLPSLIVLDTLARCFVGREENSAKDMGELVDAADKLRQEVGATVVLVHHTDKKGVVARGSSALLGGVNTITRVSRKDGAVTLKCEKQKDSEAFKDLSLRLVRCGESCVLQPSTRSRTPSLSQKQRQALQALNDQEGGLATYGNWHKASKLSNNTFNRIREQLETEELVVKAGRHYRITNRGKTRLRPVVKTRVAKTLAARR